ncbi:glyoxylate/hydroxypyruvate reductase A [Thalassotalea sp. M1531]|uniref:Glyoxylate/hydroxypyruvate reductase A n=1 Tax=Thalassotalea algicola TaxID=2716224 RepID=A0A7Y0LED8_9GAMM|nr:glyoxylate/hydroxypyruvate reductase A [Thalassotalea algicola]NMP33009.1 glyoxylate/hydroxypyruvate reductase A [Thalassotalea algicola]
MSIALMITDRDLSSLSKALSDKLPDVAIKQWPDCCLDKNVEFAVAWRHPMSMWQQFPNLKVVSSLGAGVDGLITDQSRPEHIQLTRIVDNNLSIQMSEFVLTAILMHKCRINEFQQASTKREWVFHPRLKHDTVTILGAGEIGMAVAERLNANGFSVSTWSQTKKSAPYIAQSFTGDKELHKSVENAAFVVSILPATKDTDNIVNKRLLSSMPKHAYFINVGRGNAVDEKALLHALDKEFVSGALLDVFKDEPLPETHAFWQCKKLQITPHISAITEESAIVEQIVDNYLRFKQKKPLKNRVNVENGY